jgi:hypothetical protein
MTSEELPSHENKGKSPSKPALAPPSNGPSFAEHEHELADLSREIVKILPHTAQQRVTCRRINGSHYRCNWWTPQNAGGPGNQSMTGLIVTTHRVSKSEVLHVTKTAEGLIIK